MSLQALIIVNQRASSYKKHMLKDVLNTFRANGYMVDVFNTKKKGDAQARSQEAVKEGYPLIIAAGGDGTINEIINGIAFTDVCLGVLPFGGENVLGREIGLNRHLTNAINTIINGKAHNITLGRITNSDGKVRYFSMMAGIGFDAAVVYGVNTRIKRISSRLAHVISGLKAFSNHQPILNIKLNGQSYAGYWLIAANGAKYGGNLIISPDANIESDNLNVVIFQKNGKLDTLRYVFGIITSRHLYFVDVMSAVCTPNTVIEVEGVSHVQIDGEYFGMTPCKIESVPNAIKIQIK
ncbi:MAG: diacylglycerol kinase family lipid kinase [Candidatus Magnetoovum sp. WYHC-5]|nr:diacylglycerol kinase family lipid kinase [Candidatus Magnetoovum sp. WYHC-5]